MNDLPSAYGHCMTVERPVIESATFRSLVQRPIFTPPRRTLKLLLLHYIRLTAFFPGQPG